MRDNEKMFNLPDVIVALLGAMAAIQLFVAVGPKQVVEPLFDSLAFIPLRLSLIIDPGRVLDAVGQEAADTIAALPGGGLVAGLTPLTYALLHGGWTHFGINALTLSAFGAPVARRFGSWLFLLFFASCAVAGALTHFLIHPLDAAPVVGASAAISGTMAAIVRFTFTPGARLGEKIIDGREGRAASLSQLGENRQAVFFLVVWFGANFFFGAFPEAAGSSEPIAWEAHLGGFLFGLLSFGAFDWARERA